MLLVENLDLFYGDAQALDAVSLEVPQGEIAAIVGEAAVETMKATVSARPSLAATTSASPPPSARSPSSRSPRGRTSSSSPSRTRKASARR